MGFGRLGSAVPLGEDVSLVEFDASVPEVLQNLRAARQPNASREVCVCTCESKSVVIERGQARDIGFSLPQSNIKRRETTGRRCATVEHHANRPKLVFLSVSTHVICSMLVVKHRFQQIQ